MVFTFVTVIGEVIPAFVAPTIELIIWSTEVMDFYIWSKF